MSTGKYSPTVQAAYSANQNWWKNNAGEEFVDDEGYDQYGYNAAGHDRAGYREDDYLGDDGMFFDIVRDLFGVKNDMPFRLGTLYVINSVGAKSIHQFPCFDQED